MSRFYRWKASKDRALDPFCRSLSWTGITPNMVTGAGLVVCTSAGLVAASGHLRAGTAIFCVGACLDAVDGSLARVTGRASEFGRYFDGISDRLSETAFILGAIVAGAPAAAGAVIAGSVLLLASRVHNHRRGLSSDAGMFGRPERLLLLVAGMLAPFPANLLLFVAAAVLCVVSSCQVLASARGAYGADR